MSKKILIITVPFGDGHYATAVKIAELLHERDASLQIEILDVVTDSWPAFATRSNATYQKSTAHHNAFWFKLYYMLSDKFPQPLRWFSSVAFGKYARQKLAEVNPDLVIATFPFLGHVAVKARRALGMKVPVLTVVTDAGQVQGIWLTGSEDTILAATPDTVDYAQRRQLAADKVKFIGFPVGKAFYELPPKAEAREALGLDPSVFTLLWTSGGFGMSAQKSLTLLKQVSQLPVPLQIICLAGKNAALKAQFEALSFPPHIKVVIFGYSNQMPRLMAAADIIVSKSGWLTISEALAARRPLFLFDAIPGHEEQNARYVTSQGFGVYEPVPEVMVQKISKAATQPQALKPHLTALAKVPDAGVHQRLADYLIGLLA